MVKAREDFRTNSKWNNLALTAALATIWETITQSSKEI
jgi:hypothetical protein